VCLLLTAVQLLVGDAQLFDHAAIDNRFFDDAGHIGEFDAAIPDRLRIDHYRRAKLALIETARGVGPHQRLEAAALDFLLEGVAKGLSAIGIAAAAAVTRLPAIDANENVVGELRHFRRVTVLALVVRAAFAFGAVALLTARSLRAALRLTAALLSTTLSARTKCRLVASRARLSGARHFIRRPRCSDARQSAGWSGRMHLRQFVVRY